MSCIAVGFQFSLVRRFRFQKDLQHLVLKGLFSEAAAAALSVEELLEHGRLQLLCFC